MEAASCSLPTQVVNYKDICFNNRATRLLELGFQSPAIIIIKRGDPRDRNTVKRPLADAAGARVPRDRAGARSQGGDREDPGVQGDRARLRQRRRAMGNLRLHTRRANVGSEVPAQTQPGYAAVQGKWCC